MDTGKPFIALYEEQAALRCSVVGSYDEQLQMKETENGCGITHVETNTGGHGDTDTDTD